MLAKIYPADTKAKELPVDIAGIILSGGPQSVYDALAPQIDKDILYLGKPVLGICYGHQLMAQALGGQVRAGAIREYGQAELKTIGSSPLFKEIKNSSIVWMSHGDAVKDLPNGFTTIGSTDDCANATMADEERGLFGLQFHPEVRHTSQGMKIIKNFVLDICQAEQNWKIENILKSLSDKIKAQVGNRKVFALISGGVDSSVAFALLTKTLGEQNVKGLYIDTGFMRKNESEEIKESFIKAGFNNLETFNAAKIFFKKLKGVSDPEEKRKIIGQTFLDIKEEVSKQLKLNPEEWLLGQGTIYPDTIETGGTKHADTIKTHHNRIGALQKMAEEGLVVEPIADFYKDEVRQIGHLLKIPKNIVERHPFPGPGLAIRCLCRSVNQEKSAEIPTELEIIRESHNINYKILPLKSVGVQGDNRTYAHPLALWNEDNWGKLNLLSTQITNQFKEINRCLLLLSDQESLAQSSPREAYLTTERISLLQEIDNIVNQIIKSKELYDKIWQFPVVLIPFGSDKKPESIVLRPVVSAEAMTANFARLNKDVANEMTEQILAFGKIANVFYDITNKPPGTIEWE